MRRVALGACACLVLAGCGTLMEIRPLATGNAGVAAYELAGADLSALRREAQRLCPQGADVLRQSSQDQAPENIDGRVRNWMNQAVAWADAPQRAAQLMVVCRPADTSLPPPARPKAVRVAGPPPVPSTAVGGLPPVGPLSVEW